VAAPPAPSRLPQLCLLCCPVCRRHSLSLYANISSIRWDYDSEDVAGCAYWRAHVSACDSAGAAFDGPASLPRAVPSGRTSLALTPVSHTLPHHRTLSADIAPPGGAPVRPFFVDAKTHTQYEVAERLWGAIGDAYAAAS
jgi:hypothetical protein